MHDTIDTEDDITVHTKNCRMRSLVRNSIDLILRMQFILIIIKKRPTYTNIVSLKNNTTFHIMCSVESVNLARDNTSNNRKDQIKSHD